MAGMEGGEGETNPTAYAPFSIPRQKARPSLQPVPLLHVFHTAVAVAWPPPVDPGIMAQTRTETKKPAMQRTPPRVSTCGRILLPTITAAHSIQQQMR